MPLLIKSDTWFRKLFSLTLIAMRGRERKWACANSVLFVCLIINSLVCSETSKDFRQFSNLKLLDLESLPWLFYISTFCNFFQIFNSNNQYLYHIHSMKAKSLINISWDYTLDFMKIYILLQYNSFFFFLNYFYSFFEQTPM